ncbi:MAG TPA: amino acid permease [Candidatus Limnocylindria bacterium]|jgi:amino acid transporter|nr:amino acid permease [Candidatus Limnocylindria bacterium]
MTQATSREDAIRQDMHDLHGLGYAQELLRSMGGFSNFAISFSIISILTGAVILYNLGLTLAGPAAVGIGWLLVTVFTLMIAATMAEIASAYPTAGGLYYWASKLRNKDWGWWTAWLNLGGQVSIVAGINYSAAFYLCATILNPLFGIDPNLETFGVLNAIWITGILIAIEIGFNVAGTRIVSFMNDLSVWWHIFFVAAIAFCLFAFGSQPTHDLGFLFTVQPGTNADGVSWSQVIPFGVAGAFALSLLQSQWTYTGYDASAHVAEETVFARRASAWGVFLSVAVSAVVGYIVLVALTLKMTSPADVLANSGGGGGVQYILESNLGAGLSALGGLLAAGVAFAMTFCGFSSIASAGRMLFAFSRDDGVPGSGWLKKVSHRWRTPGNAVFAISLFSWLLILLIYVLTKMFGGDPLFLIGGITSVSTVLLYWAYGVCIWLGMRGDQSWRQRQSWSLGRWSRPLAWLSVIWIVLFSPVFLYPFALNPASWMIVGAFLVLLLVYYFGWARGRFRGPVPQGTTEQLEAIEREFEDAVRDLEEAPASS